MNQREEKFEKLTTRPVGGLICSMAVPCMISMLITAFYNLADTFFVGQLQSNSATGAVGVAFSLMAIIQAIGFFFGHGSGNYISRELGRQNNEEASKMAATGFFLSLLCGFLLLVLGEIFLTPLVRLLGSTETIVPYARSYVCIILIGAPWMTASLVLNNQLRFQGSASYGMVGIAAGAVLNIGLDPLLIFVFDLGIAGAAIATIFSQFVSFCLLLVGCTRGGNLRIHPKLVQFKSAYLIEILRGGLPSLSRQGLSSVAAIVLNHAAGVYGDAAIAAMTVVSRAMMTAASALIGFGQGFQPVCGFNYGANRWDRVRQGFWFCVKSSTGFLILASVLGWIFAPQVIAVFRNDPEVIAYGALALRLQCLTFALNGWMMMSNMMMQTINRTVPATFLAMARQGIFLIPLLWVLPHFLDMLGVQIAQPIADVFAFACSIPLQLKILRELKAGPSSQNPL
jgi:putative MATE family efflux protein